MEHCKGGDLLEQLLKEGRAMPEKRVVREVVLPSLTALAHLHAAGIIHRHVWGWSGEQGDGCVLGRGGGMHSYCAGKQLQDRGAGTCMQLVSYTGTWGSGRGLALQGVMHPCGACQAGAGQGGGVRTSCSCYQHRHKGSVLGGVRG